MDEYENAHKVAKTVEMDGRHLLGHEAFKERLESLNTMQSILAEVEHIENENASCEKADREAERMSQERQVDAEYEAAQERNLLLMVIGIKEDMASKLKPLQVDSAARWAEAFSKDGKPEDPIMLDHQSLYHETSMKERRQELLKLMSKHKVDPEWFRQ